MNTWILALVQTAVLLLIAPLLSGWVKWVKCKLQCRQGPAPWQPYRDLAKLMRKEVVVSEQASPLFRATPYLVFSVTVLASSVVPAFAVGLPTAAIADAIVMVGFFALGRFFLSLAGMDIGTAFGGMGASREVTISSLAEPAMLLSIFTLSMTFASTNLDAMVQFSLTEPFQIHPSFIFSGLSLLLVATAECGRIPIDNPATHLELTMVHEAMILEYSGRHLALLEWASMLKMLIFGVLITNLFIPWGVALTQGFIPLSLGALSMLVKLMLLGAVLAVSESVLAKMRLFRAPEFLSLAFILSLLGMLSHVVLEVR